MEILESKIGETLVVALSGHLDTASSTPLEERLRTRIEEGARLLALDLSNLEYVNSSGLKAILITAKHVESTAGKFVLCGLSANVHMIFEMIGFTRILNIVATREDALRALESVPAAPPAPGPAA